MACFVVWGTGPAKSELIRNGEASCFAVEAAKQNGFTMQSSEDWAVIVEALDEHDVNATTLFDPAVKGWREAISVEKYVLLTKTQHGKHVWIATDDLNTIDIDLRESRHIVLGPYLIGPDGYATIEEAVESDPDFYGSLDDPVGWENSDNYHQKYYHEFLDNYKEGF